MDRKAVHKIQTKVIASTKDFFSIEKEIIISGLTNIVTSNQIEAYFRCFVCLNSVLQFKNLYTIAAVLN